MIEETVELMEPTSNLSPLASLDSLEGSISESEKPLMNSYVHMNMSGQQNGIYKLNSSKLPPQVSSTFSATFFSKSDSSSKRVALDNSCSFKSHQPFTSFKGNLQVTHSSSNNLNSSKRKLDPNDSYSSYNSHHENNENQNDENFLQPSLGAGGEINMEVNKKYLSFSTEQVLCMCEALQQKNDIEKLTTFLWSLPPDDLTMNNESILRARAVVAYHRNSFHELYALLESHCFHVDYHPDLQGLW